MQFANILYLGNQVQTRVLKLSDVITWHFEEPVCFYALGTLLEVSINPESDLSLPHPLAVDTKENINYEIVIQDEQHFSGAVLCINGEKEVLYEQPNTVQRKQGCIMIVMCNLDAKLTLTAASSKV